MKPPLIYSISMVLDGRDPTEPNHNVIFELKPSYEEIEDCFKRKVSELIGPAALWPYDPHHVASRLEVLQKTLCKLSTVIDVVM